MKQTIVMKNDVYSLQGNMIGRDVKNGPQGGKGMAGYGIDVCPTIAADSHGTPHAVAYAVKEESKVIGLDGYNQKLTGGDKYVSQSNEQ